MIDENAIRARYAAIKDQLDERGRRLFVATEKAAAGYGGTAAVSRATGVARSTIIRGAKDLQAVSAATLRVRREGAGRPALSTADPTVLEDLRGLVEPATMGDPMRPLLWVSKSREKLAVALRALNHAVSANTVAKMLTTLGFSRQVNRKTKEGSRHPDRDGQFQHINSQVLAVQADGQPVISVDTKKKELIGEYRNAGSDYRATRCPDEVKVHDFVDKELGKVAPHGIYDLATNAGWVSVGIDHDTAAFAVNSIRRWYEVVGSVRYETAGRLLITADGGGSNGSRVRLWKLELQKLADETGLILQVCHYPPGTSKWNKIEHRMFCHITQTWRGKPLVSRLAVVELIAATTTKTGLTVRCELDENSYPKAIRVTDAEMATLNIETGDCTRSGIIPSGQGRQDEAIIVEQCLRTSVLLLPLRHPTPVAKQVTTLDHLTEGRLILGVGVGGEFPKEYAACDVPHSERGARLAEGVQVLKKFFSGEPVSHQGRFFGPFEDVPIRPPPRQPGGPPVWFAGRKEAALRRIGRLGDGYLAYVITPDMYRAALDTIAAVADEAGRTPESFGTGHLLFTHLDDTYETALDRATETLSVRYAMDFRKAAARYCALGTPAQVTERIREFHAAGVRHVVLDLLGPYEERGRQIEWFATDALPLLQDLRTG